MFEKINNMFNLNEKLLNLYAKREEILSSNIANSETPNYKAMDINFKDTFKKLLNKNHFNSFKITLQRTSKNHLTPKLKKNDISLFSIEPVKTKNIKIDGNTVDMNRERIEFIKNTLKYEENIIFIKNEIKNIIHVLKG
ncbi:flagellar basal body rod protein FlgB [Buchnera aphidicola (Aphis craccivora)]|uniref:Flagellar basal body rod protein FlgB n=1 Tax=Buchnera aphidicola (Aphis craccivora) TaxID=466616 RepID=A0A4D6XLT0_9GAMM|nr:flagellar basal body rod protein FlgB [Buchnera aphidicola]QCI16579.1 flagellar basal body rod protein FlgB [Buchnera aphidicola (Aphis craccivora)]QLL40713.1 flagellar basal body rod protein FlgB [Buchnera aphidicola (Aphis craccivore)]WAI17552.1 MAG: flagellar basal body rod protein FlgB [Buchnera aphidicola (Aphis craccivora)]